VPRKATIGPAVFARVNELVGEGKSRTEAFAAVATERGQRPGTVAANYYRIARTQGASSGTRRRSARKTSTPRKPRPRRAAAAPARSPARSADADLTAIASEIAALTKQLVSRIEERDTKLRALLG